MIDYASWPGNLERSGFSDCGNLKSSFPEGITSKGEFWKAIKNDPAMRKQKYISGNAKNTWSGYFGQSKYSLLKEISCVNSGAKGSQLEQVDCEAALLMVGRCTCKGLGEVRVETLNVLYFQGLCVPLKKACPPWGCDHPSEGVHTRACFSL